MKHLLVLWVMVLMLVLWAGTSSVALVDPFLDGIMDPTNTLNDGSEDDDHPWGGDQAPANPDGATITRPSRLIMTTGFVPLDQLLNALVCTVLSEVCEPERVSTVSSSRVVADDPSVYTKGVTPNRPWSKKRGVDR